MSSRAHFWLRTVGLAVIVALELGPRLWASSVPAAPHGGQAVQAAIADR